MDRISDLTPLTCSSWHLSHLQNVYLTQHNHKTRMAATSASDANNLFLDLVIANPDLYVKQAKWFDYLQDEGAEITEDEKVLYSGNPNKKKRECVMHGVCYYSKLYQLAKIMVHLYRVKGGPVNEDEDDAAFPRISMSQGSLSKNAHQIGTFVVKRRRKVARGDINGISDAEFTAQTQRDEYKDKDSFYFLSQVELLRWANNKWGRSQAGLMKFTPEDKLRLMGIVLGMEDLKDYIGDLTKATKSGPRRSLDGSNPRRLAALSIAHAYFIDKEVVIPMPAKWTEANTKVTIDAHRGPGFYDTHGSFNLNNAARIALPWSKEHITSMLGIILVEYNTSMQLYTKGTGGGPGDDANYVVWQERDPANVCRYSEQGNLLYLTIVHIWDKDRGYAFIVSKDPMPAYCQIENGDKKSPSRTPAAPMKPKGLDIADLMVNVENGQKLRHQEMISVMTGTGSNDDGNQDAATIVQWIGETNAQVKEFRDGLRNDVKKKRKYEDDVLCVNNQGMKKKLEKRIKTLGTSIKDNKMMIKTLKKTVKFHQENLSNAISKTKKTTMEESSDSDDSDDDSGSEDYYSTM